MNLTSFFTPGLFRSRYGLLVMLSAMLLFQSCKKEKEVGPEFPATLYLSQIKKKDGIRLFVGQKEIFDQELLRRFVSDTRVFGANDSTFTSEEKLVFRSIDSASIEGVWRNLTVKTARDTIFFESVDLLMYPEFGWAVLYNMSKHRNPLGNLWYDGYYRTKAKLVGYGDFSEVSMPMLNYKIVKVEKSTWMDGYHKSGAWGRMFSEFDPTYVSSVRATDTLAIEAFSYVFKKR